MDKVNIWKQKGKDGLNEEKKGEVSIKDLSSSKQISVAQDKFVDLLIKMIRENIN